jgi:hypothetical protein
MAMAFVSAQAQTENPTLIDHGKVKSWGILVNPQIQYAEVLGQPAFFSNVKAGIIFNQKWVVGLHGGQSLTEVPQYYMISKVTKYFNISQRGLYLEYRLFPHKLVNVSIPINGGILKSETMFENWGCFGPYDHVVTYTNFYLEPGLNIDLNVAKFVKFQIGASYRFNDAMISPVLISPMNRGFKINHHPMFNAGIIFAIEDMPNTAKQIRRAIKLLK